LIVAVLIKAPLRFPDVAVMVTMETPGEAAFVAASVSVPVPVAPAALPVALKDAVTPGGRPDTARVTAPWKPFCGCTAMALVLEPPCARLRIPGVAVMVNEGDAVMASVIPAVLVRLPEAPVMVTVEVDATAELFAISVSVLAVVALAGLNEAVTPAGNPDMVRFTAPLNPCCGLTVIRLTPLAPAGMESEGVEADKLKAGALDVPVRLLIRGWPAGVPHPVARSYPGSAWKPSLLPVTMSCRSLWKLDPAPIP